MTDKPTNEPPTDAPPTVEVTSDVPVPAPTSESAPRYVPDPPPPSDQAGRDPAGADATGAEPDEEKPSRRFAIPAIRRPLDPVLAIVAGVLGLIALLFALMLFAPDIMPVKLGAAGGAGSTEEVEEVARRFSETLLTFSYETLDTHLDRVAEDATGAFEKRYVDTLGQLREQLTDAKADSTGNVVDVAVSPPTDETARAIVTAQRTIKNDQTPDPQTTPAILELSLVKTSDGWKIDNVGQLQRVQL